MSEGNTTRKNSKENKGGVGVHNDFSLRERRLKCELKN